MSALTNSLTDSVNHGVVEVFENQKRVEEAARALNETSSKFRERSQAWATSLEEFDKELRTIGDFENWVKSMEHDLSTLASALEKRCGKRRTRRENRRRENVGKFSVR